jgi:hypothetical protein
MAPVCLPDARWPEPGPQVEGTRSRVTGGDPQREIFSSFSPHSLGSGGNQEIGGSAAARIGADPHGHQFPLRAGIRPIALLMGDNGDQANRFICSPGDEGRRGRGTATPLTFIEGQLTCRCGGKCLRSVGKGGQSHGAQGCPFTGLHATDTNTSHPPQIPSGLRRPRSSFPGPGGPGPTIAGIGFPDMPAPAVTRCRGGAGRTRTG